MKIADGFVKHPAASPSSMPKWFLEKLYQIGNGRLRLRWSEEYSQWALEIKVTRASQYIKDLPHYKHRWSAATGHIVRTFENDSWVRARDGYMLVGYYYPYALKYPDWILNDIQFNDMRRFVGGPAEVARIVEERESRERNIRNKDDSQSNYDWAEDFYNTELWRQGNRAAVPANYDQVQ